MVLLLQAPLARQGPCHCSASQRPQAQPRPRSSSSSGASSRRSTSTRSSSAEPHWLRQVALGGAVAAFLALQGAAGPALGAPSVLAHSSARERPSALPSPPADRQVYWGNGCFWGRQKDFTDLEVSIGRSPEQLSAVVGYAGGRGESPDGRVCYYRGPRDTVYEGLGHAEVVGVELGEKDTAEFARFAELYFSQFQTTPFGQLRLDPMDTGPGYRNVVGLPGGVASPYFRILQEKNTKGMCAVQEKNTKGMCDVQEKNTKGMKLVEGRGNEYVGGKPTEDDRINTVWILDSTALKFNRAEEYHQHHNGIGHPFPSSYTVEQKNTARLTGRIGPTGCPEYSGLFG